MIGIVLILHLNSLYLFVQAFNSHCLATSRVWISCLQVGLWTRGPSLFLLCSVLLCLPFSWKDLQDCGISLLRKQEVVLAEPPVAIVDLLTVGSDDCYAPQSQCSMAFRHWRDTRWCLLPWLFLLNCYLRLFWVWRLDMGSFLLQVLQINNQRICCDNMSRRIRAVNSWKKKVKKQFDPHQHQPKKPQRWY